MLKILAPQGEVFPYLENAKRFLQAGAGANPADYYVEVFNAYLPIPFAWKYDGEGVGKFLVEYARKEDFSDAIMVEVAGDKREVALYNLYKASDYFTRVTALDKDGNMLERAFGTFQTTLLGPRVMNIDGIFNVRDIGGYTSLDGQTVLQGVAYRGGALNVPLGEWSYRSELSDEGKRYMSETLGIKAELDFRPEKETGRDFAGGSVIPGASFTNILADGYEKIFVAPYCEGYRKVFSFLADKGNYPLYMHCTAGADRTGTVSFLLLAMLGVSELECRQDYAFTSFSVYGLRGEYVGENAGRYREMIRLLKTFDGETLQEQTKNYLLSIGVTKEEISSIEGIFFGENTD